MKTKTMYALFYNDAYATVPGWFGTGRYIQLFETKELIEKEIETYYSKSKDLISIKRKISELEKSKEKNDLINSQIEDLINLSIPIKEKIFHEKVICMMKASKKHAVLKSTVNKILYLKYDINFDY